MNYEWIQNFLSSPELPDIISYIFVLFAFMTQVFVKKGVKKDNLFTFEKINIKVNKVNDLYDKLDETYKKLNKERKEWFDEKKELKKEIETLKQAVRLCSGNTKDLVKSGVANTVNKMLDNTVNHESTKSNEEGNCNE